MTVSSPEAAIARDHMRFHMVDSQVRPNQVNDTRIIAAMRRLPREDFAPAGSRPYADADIDLGNSRYMLRPLTIARLAQLVLAGAPKTILVIGAGAGYGAAILAAAGATVTALESDPALDTGGLARHAPEVRRLKGPLTDGDGSTAPYDAILIEGAVFRIPETLAPQLAPSGRLVTILADGTRNNLAGGILGRAVIAEHSGRHFACVEKFDATARIIPDFMPAATFVF
jgi:protein-L-isoaspartate(D-aspartate) O-methyltransferase